jgi:hypothetical protein
MRFHRFGKYEFRAAARKQKAEREALLLLADKVAAEQIDVDEEMTAHQLQLKRQQAADHKRRADKWREARRRLNGYEEPVRGALPLYWQGCKWPADPSYFLSVLHLYDTGRLSQHPEGLSHVPYPDRPPYTSRIVLPWPASCLYARGCLPESARAAR